MSHPIRIKTLETPPAPKPSKPRKPRKRRGVRRLSKRKQLHVLAEEFRAWEPYTAPVTPPLQATIGDRAKRKRDR